MGRILIVEFSDANNPVFEEIMQLLHHSSGFSELSVADTSILSVPGLEINLQQRRVCYNNQEIRFTIKDMKTLNSFFLAENDLVSFGKEIALIAGKHNIKVASCAETFDLSSCGIEHNCCIDKE